MNKFLVSSLLIAASVMTVGCSQAKEQGRSGSAYAQLSSAETQKVKSGAITPIRMELQDLVKGVSVDASAVVIDKPGTYLLIAAPQVSKFAGPAAAVDVFLRINGKDVANSNVRVLFDSKGYGTDVLVSQGILDLKKGDRVQVMMAGDAGSNVGVEAIQPEGRPLVPSIIFSLVRLGD